MNAGEHLVAQRFGGSSPLPVSRFYKKSASGAEFALPDPELDPDHPENGFQFRVAQTNGATTPQLAQAQEMWERGLCSKAKRKAYCGILGARRECASGDPEHRFYIPYGCGLRYCEACGPHSFAKLFAKHGRLAEVARQLVPHWPVYGHKPDRVMATVDFTSLNTGVMPGPGQIRKFNQNIRKFWRAVEREFGIVRSDYGFIWCDEFGGEKKRPGRTGNTNLHAHGMYCGPWLPQKNKELSKLWERITGDGSFIVYIKTARNFGVGLGHALKYAGKFLSTDPQRLAELEVAFHRIRRVHAIGRFYNPKLASEQSESLTDSEKCPICGDRVGRPSGAKLLPIRELEKAGLKNLREIRRQMKLSRAITVNLRAGP